LLKYQWAGIWTWYRKRPCLLLNVWMYLQLHSAKEPSKNHDICVRVLFGSLRDGFDSGYCTFFTFGFGSWQNVGSGSVHSCWVRVLSHL